MTQEEKQNIRKIQSTLQNIDKGLNVFFNIALFEKLGLTYSTKNWGIDAYGNKVVTSYRHHLTDKAKKYISVMV